jgi:hypothetical protein
MPFHTEIKLNDGSSQHMHTTDEIEISPENGMTRLTFFNEVKRQILVRTDLIISIIVEEEEETKNPEISTE